MSGMIGMIGTTGTSGRCTANGRKDEGTDMKERIREKLLALGANLCGFAGIERFAEAPAGFHPRDVFPGCNSVVAFGIALPKGLYAADARMVYSYYNSFACPEVDRIALRTAAYLEDSFHGLGVPLPCDGPYEYWDESRMEGRGLISMKHAAALSGLGTLGKSTLLLNGKYGNRLVVGCVLTDLQLASDPLADSICLADCDECIRNCPAGAIGEGGVEQKACRLNTYVKNRRGFDAVDCTRCRTVCPMRFGLAQA